MISRVHVLWMSCLLVFVLDAPSRAIDIEQTIWGFDGNVVPHRFNPVSLLVSNHAEEPVAVRLELRRSHDRLGAKVQEEVFLSPFSSRWVQFYPYVAGAGHEWEVSWGFLPSQRKTLSPPNIGGRARVALWDADQTAAARGGVPSFPDNLFPPFVSATDTLEAVFLDHNPRWQDPRRQSLLQWVQRGGTLFVSPTASGKYPEFTGAMAALNQPVPVAEWGQGAVVRCPDRETAVRQAAERLGLVAETKISTKAWEVGARVFHTLKAMTTPQHNWWVINTMSIIYVALVFPGWYLLAKGTAHYRTTILAFVGVSALFTVAFNLVGRRGYGESTAVNTLAIAKHVDGSLYDVQCWTNVFVTGGDHYELTFDGTGDLYATPYENERVSAVIDNGLDGKFLADIPLFSARSFLHRGTMPGPEWQLAVALDEDEKDSDVSAYERIRLKISPPPENGTPMYAVLGDQLYTVYEADEDYRMRPTRKTVDDSLLPEGFRDDGSRGYPQQQYRQWDVLTAYNRLHDVAIWFAMDRDIRVEERRALPGDVVRLFIDQDLPASFSVKHPELSASQGRVLYTFDLRLPEKLDLSRLSEPSAYDEEYGMEPYSADSYAAETEEGEETEDADETPPAVPEPLRQDASDLETASSEESQGGSDLCEDSQADHDPMPEEATIDGE